MFVWIQVYPDIPGVHHIKEFRQLLNSGIEIFSLQEPYVGKYMAVRKIITKTLSSLISIHYTSCAYSLLMRLISSKQRCPEIAYIACVAPTRYVFFMYVYLCTCTFTLFIARGNHGPHKSQLSCLVIALTLAHHQQWSS